MLSLNEKTFRVRVSLSRDLLKTLFVVDYASVYARISNFCNLVEDEKPEKHVSESISSAAEDRVEY